MMLLLNDLPSLSQIVMVARSDDNVTTSPILAWSAELIDLSWSTGLSVKLTLNISNSSGMLSSTMDTLKES